MIVELLIGVVAGAVLTVIIGAMPMLIDDLQAWWSSRKKNSSGFEFGTGMVPSRPPENEKELPVGCKGCESTFPCEDTCGADPFNGGSVMTTDHDDILKYQKEGHTHHCSCRIVWGDGECECGKKDIIPCSFSRKMSEGKCPVCLSKDGNHDEWCRNKQRKGE